MSQLYRKGWPRRVQGGTTSLMSPGMQGVGDVLLSGDLPAAASMGGELVSAWWFLMCLWVLSTGQMDKCGTEAGLSLAGTVSVAVGGGRNPGWSVPPPKKPLVPSCLVGISVNLP